MIFKNQELRKFSVRPEDLNPLGKWQWLLYTVLLTGEPVVQSVHEGCDVTNNILPKPNSGLWGKVGSYPLLI